MPPLPARRKVVLHKGCWTPVPSALSGVRPVRQWSASKSTIVNSLLDGISLLAFCFDPVTTPLMNCQWVIFVITVESGEGDTSELMLSPCWSLARRYCIMLLHAASAVSCCYVLRRSGIYLALVCFPMLQNGLLQQRPTGMGRPVKVPAPWEGNDCPGE